MPEMSSEIIPVKRKAGDGSKVIHFTARTPRWTYLKLQLIHQPGTSSSVHTQPLDPLTIRTHLSSALNQFLGLAGSSISIDIIKISPETQQAHPTNKIAWIRVPRQDAAAVVIALSSWVGGTTGEDPAENVALRVLAKGNHLAALVHGSGDDLFTSSF